jgi:hypothetical protein
MEMSTRNQFFIEDVLKELMDEQKSLSGPLLRLKYFAVRTNNGDLDKFVTREIEGYSGLHPDELPDYRKAPGKIFVEISVYGQSKTIETTAAILNNPEYEKGFQYAVFREGVATIEQMAKDLIATRKMEPYIATPFPAEMYPYFERGLNKINEYPIRVKGAHLASNPYRLTEVLPTVRSRLIKFVSELANEFGYEIDITIFNQQQSDNNKIVYQIMNHTEIHTSGDGNVVNTGNSANIGASITITKNDWQALSKQLSDQGVDTADITELHSIVREEVPDNGSLGNRTIDWILKVSGKALKGIGKIATGVSSNLLATLIKGYYGIN